ncbi:MAG: peptide-methionine (S)-S-oxide reductase MsrA [Candidatus Kapaibacterium sp.]
MRYLSRSPFLSTVVALSVFLISSTGCASKQQEAKASATEAKEMLDPNKTYEHATFALGCFWHSEEIFLEIKGVKEALPGYSGGSEENPSYEMVGTGSTGYAESVDVTFDPSVVSYAKLLEVFFAEHDPTTPNYAAPDEGPQYRSVIFYHNDDQKKQAEAYIAKLTASHKYSGPIITQVSPFTKFYKAEDYHIRYFRNHPSGQSYIDHVTKPEVEKFRKDFPDLVKAGL